MARLGPPGRGAALSVLGSGCGWRPEPPAWRAVGGETLALSDSGLAGARGRGALDAQFRESCTLSACHSPSKALRSSSNRSLEFVPSHGRNAYTTHSSPIRSHHPAFYPLDWERHPSSRSGWQRYRGQVTSPVALCTLSTGEQLLIRPQISLKRCERGFSRLMTTSGKFMRRP